MFEVVYEGLLAAYKNHISLGELGKVKDRKNRFGDMALRGDIEAEEKITQVLERFAVDKNIHFICKSEELGEQDINSHGIETYMAVFDGLDGSKNYLEGSTWGYGTMFAIAKGKDPTYNNFETAGVAIMEKGMILVAQKDSGLKLFNENREERIEVSKFNPSEPYDHAKILANKAFPEEFTAIGGNEEDWTMTGSTASSIATLCTDQSYQGLIEVTRKGNLEQPTIFVMINSLGGAMVDRNGNSIGRYRINEWGQKKPDGSEDRQIVVTAKNSAIVKGILSNLNLT